MKYGKEPLLIK